VLFLVSDLHLTDCRHRSTFDFRAFRDAVMTVVAQASSEQVSSMKIVLAGDIFEMLKTTVWQDKGARPWEEPSEKRTDAVTAIMQNIVRENRDFFGFLRALCAEHSFVSLVYLPGNHDHMLNATNAGEEARKLLRQQLPLGHTDERLFLEDYQDPEHELIALHGHQWDDHNLYREDTAPIGDVVVVELLARLPILLAQHLDIAVDDPRLLFAHEIDNVIPQSPRAMALWVAKGLDGLAADRFEPRAVDLAVRDVLAACKTALASRLFEGAEIGERWLELLKAIVGILISQWGALRLALPFGSTDLRPSYAGRAAQAIRDYVALGDSYRFIVYGHTHVGESSVIAGDSEPHVYFNLGTWRRSHRMTGHDSETSSIDFASCIENTYLVVRSPNEAAAGQARYAFNSALYAC
jgi:UDP-2,3-diacylglucosamine pyrophosphatase LpxH